jgi:hypothetical protein
MKRTLFLLFVFACARYGDEPVQFVCSARLPSAMLTERYWDADSGQPLACCLDGQRIWGCKEVGSHCCALADGGFAGHCCRAGDHCDIATNTCV